MLLNQGVDNMSSLSRSSLVWLWLAVVVVVVDQLTKAWVISHLFLGQTQAWLPFLSFTRIHNYGIAFGALSGTHGLMMWILVGSAVGIVATLGHWLWRLPSHQKWLAAGLSLVIGGALGNLIDRALYGYVIDFIDFHVGAWHWYIFNGADSAICIGVVILIWQLWQEEIQLSE